MSSEPHERYEVSCYNCKGRFDALDASWCSCLTKERSLICPSCLNCFCKAPHSYKQDFWSKAPQSLWDRKIEEHKRSVALPANASVEEVKRPLVLIVDDEREIQHVAIRVIESLGYGWVLARDGDEGLTLAHRYKPEVVLTDAMMPKMDGRELTKRIKTDSSLAGTKVAVMTSLYTAAQYKYEALKEFKADEYLAKPLDINQLRTVIDKLLGN